MRKAGLPEQGFLSLAVRDGEIHYSLFHSVLAMDRGDKSVKKILELLISFCPTLAASFSFVFHEDQRRTVIVN